MSPAAEWGGLVLLLACAVIAVAELVATAYVWSLPPIEAPAERRSSIPQPYVVGSESDPFLVRGRR